MGTSPRFVSPSDYPGPGKYRPVTENLMGSLHSPNRTSMGSSSRFDRNKEQIPGPGAYAVPRLLSRPQTAGKTRTSMMGTASRFLDIDRSPGPGDYGKNAVATSSPGRVSRGISTAPRFEPLPLNSPGPSAYAPKQYNTIQDYVENHY
jgi:hypothetical protein